jgi:hypothetical protein
VGFVTFGILLVTKPTLLEIIPRTGFEPVISALKGRCPRPLDERGKLSWVNPQVPTARILPYSRVSVKHYLAFLLDSRKFPNQFEEEALVDQG